MNRLLDAANGQLSIVSDGDLLVYRDGLLCPCRDQYCSGKKKNVIHPSIYIMLQSFAYIGLDFRITSGLRCVAHNKLVGGAPESKHLEGCAVDLYFPRARASSILEIMKYKNILRYKPTATAVMRDDDSGTAIHVDFRKGDPFSVTWNYPSRDLKA